MTKPKVFLEDLGKISYQAAWDYQSEKMAELVNRKIAYYKLHPKETYQPSHHYLLTVEHPPVYTLGKSGSLDHLLLSEAMLEEKGIEFFKINRGGDITFHGPGQLVGYPILDLDGFFTDVHKYVRFLEETVISTLADFGLVGYRIEKYTGVWLKSRDGVERKICAIGVHLSRWVTLHGFAFNINTDLSYFKHIIPCGIQDDNKDVTSLAYELGAIQDFETVRRLWLGHFRTLFQVEWA